MIRTALKYPHTVVVVALVTVVLGVVSFSRLPADLLPLFKTPAVQIVTFYPGMPPEVMERDITSRLERWTGQSVGISHQEAKSMLGVSIVKDFFREDISMDTAMSQVTSYAVSDMYYLAPGTIPPMVMPFDPTASVPLALVTVSSPSMTEKELYDIAYFELRNRLQSISGVIAPAVYGGWGGRDHARDAFAVRPGLRLGAHNVLDDLTIPRYEPSVQIYYRVNPGAALARAARHRRDADAATLSVEEARRTAALQAAIGYFDVALAYAAVQIAEQLVEDSERFEAITEARAEAELGTGADVARAAADAARAKQARIRARGAWERSSVRLAVLLRWSPGRLLIPADREIRPEALVDPRTAAALHEEALRARPDLRAAKARLEAAESLSSAAWWELLGPELDMAARERLLGRELSDLGRTTLAHAFVRLSFSFEELGQLRTAQAEARAAQIRDQALGDRVRGEIETALSNLRAAEAAVPEAQAAVEATEKSYRAEFARFEAGTGLGIEVIEAQNARARARSDLAGAILRYNAAQMELAAGIGHLSADVPGLRHSAQAR